MKNSAVIFLSLLAFVAVAQATPVPPLAPEIDPGSLVTASALVGSALLMLRRRNKK